MHLKKRERSYNRGHQVHGSVLKFIVDVDLELVALRSVEIERQRKKMPINPTLLARSTGPGKTPEASVALGCTGSNTVSNSSRGRLTRERIHQEQLLR